ncbi:ATP-NAD kinase family protein [Clostridiaceae bacterium 35-E11]
MKKLGVIVNPIAGIGGRVGLKGSDGEDILKKAIELGAKSESPDRAIDALRIISKIKGKIEIVTYPKEMGEYELIKAGFTPKVIGKISGEITTPQDTIMAAQAMIEEKVDLLIFAGGDGTARNIYNAVKDKLVTLGIPTGVKIHSGVYAINPKSAGIVALQYLENDTPQVKEAEVMDLDEEEYRSERVSAKLFGFMKIPHNEHFVQNVKARSKSEDASLNSIAHNIINNMKNDIYYIIGPGTTTRRIMEILDLRNTLIGVDIIKNRKLIANDVTENGIWNIIKDNKAQIVVTVIGGQGHIFGRGNQQISPRVIRKVGTDCITIIATKEKLLSIKHRTLLVDTGDLDLDVELIGYKQVIVGGKEVTMCKIDTHN